VTLTLVRHGSTTANEDSVFHGITDEGLSPNGRAEAAKLARRLCGRTSDFSAMYVSPLKRARETARVIEEETTLRSIVCPELREIDLGRWEGLPFAVLESEHQLWERSEEDPDFAPHGGESPRELGNRVASALAELAKRHRGENVLVVSHGGAICAGLAQLLGSSPLVGRRYHMRNCAISELLFDPAPRLALLNDCDHL